MSEIIVINHHTPLKAFLNLEELCSWCW